MRANSIHHDKIQPSTEVAEAINRNLGTSPSEMSKGAVLTVSLVSGIAADVAALAATITLTADGLLSEVNMKGAAVKAPCLCG